MSADTALPLQTAIYTALSSDATLSAKISGVFDSVPQDTDFPYVTIGDQAQKDFCSITTDGGEFVVSIHTWSRQLGRAEALDLMADIYRVLHRTSLSLTSGSLILLWNEFSHTELDPDGVTYHGVQRFKALTQGG